MKITDILAKESIALGQKAADKQSVLEAMVDLMAASGKISDKKLYLEAVEAREEEGTTGVGGGIAIPHGKPVDILFLIAAPESSGNVHLQILSKLAMMLMDEKFVAELKKAKNADEFLQIIDKAEEAKDVADAQKSAAPPVTEVLSGEHLILAVTACPTGIAHTYMAAEAIEKAVKAKGYQVKVETRGSGGAKNVLTDEEIEKADGIIFAADTNVPMDRFDGK